MDLKDYIRDVPDFPKPGILFRDITPLLADHKAFGHVIDRFAEHFGDKGVTAIVAAEARGFIFAARRCPNQHENDTEIHTRRASIRNGPRRDSAASKRAAKASQEVATAASTPKPRASETQSSAGWSRFSMRRALVPISSTPTLRHHWPASSMTKTA